MSPTIGEIIGRRDNPEGDDVIQRATMLWGRETVERLKAQITDPAKLIERIQQYMKEHEAKRVEQQRKLTRPTWDDTVNAPSGRARHPALKSGPVTPKLEENYLPKDFYKMPNGFVDELLTVMPAPVLRGYVVCHRLADLYGVFWCSGETMATKIGSHDPRLGRRVITRLRQAGMLLLNARGSKATGFANTYQLVPLAMLDLDRVKDVLQRPLQDRAAATEAA